MESGWGSCTSTCLPSASVLGAGETADIVMEDVKENENCLSESQSSVATWVLG